MKSPRIVAALAAASLAVGSGAFGQSTGAQDQAMRAAGIQNPNGPLLSPQQLREQSRIERGGNTGVPAQRPADAQNRAAMRGEPYRGDPRSSYRSGRNEARSDRRDGQGAGPDHAFYRGDRLPPEYRSRQYVVDDWRGHRLSAPPRGYHWVQSGSDYLLVAIASGVIASILLAH